MMWLKLNSFSESGPSLKRVEYKKQYIYWTGGIISQIWNYKATLNSGFIAYPDKKLHVLCYFKCHLNSIMIIRVIITSIHFTWFHTYYIILYLNLWVVNVSVIWGSSIGIFSVPRREIAAKTCGCFTTDRTQLARCEVFLVINQILSCG